MELPNLVEEIGNHLNKTNVFRNFLNFFSSTGYIKEIDLSAFINLESLTLLLQN